MRTTSDEAIAALARRQHGAFNRRQARAAGLSDRVIARRLATGRWVALEPGIYALPGNPFTWERQCMAATLITPGAVVSGRSAAALHEMPGFRPGPIEVTVPARSAPRTRLAVVHRSDAVQTTRRRRIPVLTVADTVIGLASRVGTARLGEVLDELVAADATVLDDVRERWVQRAPGRVTGAATVRAVLAERGDGFVPPASRLERRLLAVYRRLPDAPAVMCQAAFPWRPASAERVDLYVPVWRAIIEADGRRWHTRVDDFERDRQRDNAAVVRGYRPVRFTWYQLTRRVDEVLATLGQLAALAAADTASRLPGRIA